MAFEKKFNKVLLGLVIGTTIAGVAGAKTPTGQKVLKKTASGFLWWAKKMIDFLQWGLEEMKKKIDEKGIGDNQ
jgi:hypothetical protein